MKIYPALKAMKLLVWKYSFSDVEGVIKYLDYYIGKDKNSFLLVMERPILYKDLFEIISDQDFLEENAACFYFKQLVQIVIACCERGVIHRWIFQTIFNAV